MRKLSPDGPPGFQTWWKAYPRKVAKLDAMKAWEQMGCEGHEELMLTALQWQIPANEWSTRPQYCPFPGTYLRAGRWMDEPLQDAEREDVF